ncbi:AP-5 complex subunit beta-1-like [Saccoglossus kowalevskii]
MDYKKIYAIVLHVDTSSNYSQIKDLHIPCLNWSSSGKPDTKCKQVTFEFCPNEPMPSIFSSSVIFSNEKGKTCSTQLDNIVLKFEDIFLPLPGLQAISKTQLFERLWHYIHQQQKMSDTDCRESVCCLNIGEEMFVTIVIGNFHPFLLKKYSKQGIYMKG